MGRKEKIARSLVTAITKTTQTAKRARSPLALILGLFSALFSLYQLTLRKIRPADFSRLRREHWEVNDDDYTQSFQPEDDEDQERPLKAIGDMGFSGSTFYSTRDHMYLVKSVPRHSEHSFFRDDLLTPYVHHMAHRPNSLLVRICDFLAVTGPSIGRLFRLAPSHHIVMENIMYGKEDSSRWNKNDWQNWDLKPTSYFYPERDIANGALTSDATKDQLADKFKDKIVLRRSQADDLLVMLEEDTKLLAEHNAVDYSLFLVRIKRPGSTSSESQDLTAVPVDPPSAPPGPPTWRTGIPSADGKYLFRASILDFFWAKHKAQPQAMTRLISLWNLLISRQGHMSITTTPDEYRERFLKMCREIVEVKED
ncbi:hypothetical protein B0J18DRAFT_427504 [Chaetomium sp. MPI-SDFR-AT-0129]|nr:hypothetical protein B0J18DRAFT_427504 [Chaetomium sp. MPI-SDFR-AT-0129]